MPVTPNGRWSPDGIDGADNVLAALAQMQNTNEAADNVTRGMIAAPNAASQAVRDALYPAPKQGNRVWREDLGWEETYFGTYNVTSNPGGATPAGWYPTQGMMPRFVVSKAATQNIGTGGWSAFQWNTLTLVENRGGFVVPTASPFNIQVPYPGYYDVTWETTWAASGTGTRSIRIETDGVSPFTGMSRVERNPVQNNSVNQLISATVLTTSIIRTMGYQDTGADLGMSGAKLIIIFRGPKQ